MQRASATTAVAPHVPSYAAERKDDPMTSVGRVPDEPQRTTTSCSSDDIEVFRNPFLPRRSSTKPFFSCIEDREAWDQGSWIKEQTESKFIQALLETMKTQPHVALRYVLIKGILHLRADKMVSASRNRIVVPESLRAFIIGQHHNMDMHAHQGRKRTSKMICSRYY